MVDDLKIGFIGAGKAGCSLGKYFFVAAKHTDLQVAGYYSLIEEEARWAATYTESLFFKTVAEVVAASDTIILSTPDRAIKDVWELVKKEDIDGKIICHLSGSLSSDVFSGIEHSGAYPISIHPMFAFSNKESIYQQLNDVSFTLEGHWYAVKEWKKIFKQLGNEAIEISKDVKPKYHAAASLLSNHVIAILSTGYHLLEECGFSQENARQFTSILVKENVEQCIHSGCISSLTGPIERADIETVRKHLEVIGPDAEIIYRACGMELLQISKMKNEDRNYDALQEILKGKDCH